MHVLNLEMERLNQIERIKKKLILAKDADKELEVFAADSHEYILGETVSHDEILKFEKEYSVSLPECYKTFLLHIGNGGVSSGNAGAGPGYGIFPLGKNVDEFIQDNVKEYLKEDCKIFSKMNSEFWEELNENISENISDEDFEIEIGKIFSGILPIGTQGCTYFYGLVLNGNEKGRIVNIDIDRQQPYFAFESNFLDWYERWLDEITAEVSEDDSGLFHYTLGGAVSYILDVYNSTNDKEIKQECLWGILKKKKIDSKTLDILEKEYKSSEIEIQKRLLQILVKFDYDRAHSYLIDFAEKDLLSVYQFIFWYAKDKSTDWFEFIKNSMGKINDEETFNFCTYVLKEMDIDYSSILIPFTSHENEEIRVTAYYSLGQLENKKKYLEVFIKGLNDSANRVIHITLQALKGIKDEKLLIHYKNIAERFPKEQDYILVNLNHRLEEFGLTNKTIKKVNY